MQKAVVGFSLASFWPLGAPRLGWQPPSRRASPARLAPAVPQPWWILSARVPRMTIHHSVSTHKQGNSAEEFQGVVGVG